MLYWLVVFGCFLGGAVIGGVYLVALWHTVKRFSEQSKTKVWFLFSAFIRVIVVVGVFYYLSAGDFFCLVALLFGFMIVRYLGLAKVIKKEKKTELKTV